MDRMKSDSIPFDAVTFDLFWFGDSIKNTGQPRLGEPESTWLDPEKMIRNWKEEHTDDPDHGALCVTVIR
ncbi:MAG: hypothetical protein U0T56_10605 [Ferruginibacter sp.]